MKNIDKYTSTTSDILFKSQKNPAKPSVREYVATVLFLGTFVLCISWLKDGQTKNEIGLVLVGLFG